MTFLIFFCSKTDEKQNDSLETLPKLVLASKPTACLLDPLPTKHFKDLWTTLGLLNMVVTYN